MTAPTPELPAALRGRRLVVVDVEGNGRQPPEIIELAALPVDDTHRGLEADMRTWLIRPRTPINPLVTRKIHGISNTDVADSPAWADVSDEIAALLHDRVLVAHNASVEFTVITAHLPHWRPPMVLDTLKLAKHLWPDLRGYGLDKLAAHTGIDPAGFAASGHHRAAYDTWCAWRLLLHLIDDGQLDWTGLLKTAALPAFAPPPEPEGGLW
ncbi:3'-5' exonuclease [Actinokineospora sp. NPDC004072]